MEAERLYWREVRKQGCKEVKIGTGGAPLRSLQGEPGWPSAFAEDGGEVIAEGGYPTPVFLRKECGNDWKQRSWVFDKCKKAQKSEQECEKKELKYCGE